MTVDDKPTVAAIARLAEAASDEGRVIAPAIWKHGNGLFGGFTATLALATAAQRTRLRTIASAQVLFARSTEPGILDIVVEEVYRGSASAAVVTRVRQGDTDRVLVQAWLVDQPIEVGECAPLAVPDPAACAEVTYFDETLPFMRSLDERAIDYPISLADFLGGPPVADLWVRAAGDGEDDPLGGQLLDVLALDTHMVDAAFRPHRTVDFVPVSLDLNVWWSSSLVTEWRRVRVEASGPGERLAPITATVWAADGTVRARGSQLARFAARRNSGPH